MILPVLLERPEHDPAVSDHPDLPRAVLCDRCPRDAFRFLAGLPGSSGPTRPLERIGDPGHRRLPLYLRPLQHGLHLLGTRGRADLDRARRPDRLPAVQPPGDRGCPMAPRGREPDDQLGYSPGGRCSKDSSGTLARKMPADPNRAQKEFVYLPWRYQCPDQALTLRDSGDAGVGQASTSTLPVHRKAGDHLRQWRDQDLHLICLLFPEMNGPDSRSRPGSTLRQGSRTTDQKRLIWFSRSGSAGPAASRSEPRPVQRLPAPRSPRLRHKELMCVGCGRLFCDASSRGHAGPGAFPVCPQGSDDPEPLLHGDPPLRRDGSRHRRTSGIVLSPRATSSGSTASSR